MEGRYSCYPPVACVAIGTVEFILGSHVLALGLGSSTGHMKQHRWLSQITKLLILSLFFNSYEYSKTLRNSYWMR